MKQGDARNQATRVLYDPEAQKGTLKSRAGLQEATAKFRRDGRRTGDDRDGQGKTLSLTSLA